MELAVSREVALQSFDKQCVFRFDEGIPGFEKACDWIILSNPAEEPFAWLQSLTVPDLSFVVVDPWVICPTYAAKISDYDVGRLGIRSPDDTILLVIVSVKDRVEEMTANLIGPVLLNVTGRRGAQVVIQNCTDYSSNHKILEGLEARERRLAARSGKQSQGGRYAGADTEVKSKHHDQQ